MKQLNYKRKQTGVVLFVSLVILLIMTLLGITSMQTTILEEKMAGNYRDRNMAFQSAESALRAAEKYLNDTAGLSELFIGTNRGHYQPTASGAARWDDSITDWFDTANDVITYPISLKGISEDPVYILEEMPFVNEGGSLEAGNPQSSNYYRVTTRATGGTDTAVVMLQSTYKH